MTPHRLSDSYAQVADPEAARRERQAFDVPEPRVEVDPGGASDAELTSMMESVWGLEPAREKGVAA